MTETYSMGYSQDWLRFMSTRSGSNAAAHVMRLMHTDMNVLDVGCGPGSITVDLAEFAVGGHVTGLDVNEDQFTAARSLASNRGVSNADFRAGSVYSLPFEDDQFDVVTENALVMHLAEPERALMEMMRVLRPGGIIGLRDNYMSGRVLYGTQPFPLEGGLARVNEIERQVLALNGADTDAGIHHRRRLEAFGFTDVEAGASPEVFGSTSIWTGVANNPSLNKMRSGRVDRMVEEGLMSQTEARAYMDWTNELRTDAGAVMVVMWMHATGRKPL